MKYVLEGLNSKLFSSIEWIHRAGTKRSLPDKQLFWTDIDDALHADLDAGIEVTYDPDDKDELVWI